jgi:hypothetical protein
VTPLGHRGRGQVFTGLHRLCHGGESTAQQVILQAVARAAVSYKRGCDRISDLIGHSGICR